VIVFPLINENQLLSRISLLSRIGISTLNPNQPVDQHDGHGSHDRHLIEAIGVVHELFDPWPLILAGATIEIIAPNKKPELQRGCDVTEDIELIEIGEIA
jgi:hypothetical protein